MRREQATIRSEITRLSRVIDTAEARDAQKDDDAIILLKAENARLGIENASLKAGGCSQTYLCMVQCPD